MSKQKKKIVIVANTTWNIYNFRLNVIRELFEQGFEVVVIAPIDKYIHYKKQFPQVAHYPLKRLNRDSVNPIKDIQLLLELNALYKRIQPDVILHYTVKPNIYGGIAARLQKIPSIAVVTGLGYAFIHNGYIEAATKILYRLTSSFHEKIIFENIDDRLLFIKEKLIKSEQGISIKGCGLNVTYFHPYPNGVVREKTIFTFIGRLLYDKGIKEFVDAARILKSQYDNVEFWLVGEIDDKNPAAVKKDDLMSWVKEDIVVYHGATNDVRKFIADSDCIVLPSYREAIARSITEGMAMEKPVITTDTAGCREAVDDGENGFLVPIKNADALAKAMNNVYYLSPEQRHQMGENGRKKALAEFDDRLIAEEIVSIVKLIL